MTTIHFVTGNSGKYKEVCSFVNRMDPNITIEQVGIDLPEMQSLDIKKIAINKAKQAWMHIKKPLIVEDGGVFLERYNQFPGALSKFVFEGIGLEGVLDLARHDNRASMRTCLVYIDSPQSYHTFEGRCDGVIKDPGKGVVIDPKLPFRAIFFANGSTISYEESAQTEGHMADSHRGQALRQFVAWYKDHENTSTL